jgi:hypothetical protein
MAHILYIHYDLYPVSLGLSYNDAQLYIVNCLHFSILELSCNDSQLSIMTCTPVLLRDL